MEPKAKAPKKIPKTAPAPLLGKCDPKHREPKTK